MTSLDACGEARVVSHVPTRCPWWEAPSSSPSHSSWWCCHERLSLVDDLGLLPLIGSIVVALLPKSKPTLAKQVSLVVSGAVLALTIAMALQFDGASTQPFQFVESYPGSRRSASRTR